MSGTPSPQPSPEWRRRALLPHGDQVGIAAGGGRVDRDRLLGGEAQEVVRAAGLGARAGEAMAADGG